MSDVSVVGAGPNGLAAAVVMARAGLTVRVFETESTVGGGSRTKELMEPGHLHDICSAVHPMALASPFFRSFGLDRRIGLAVPEISYASPLDGGRAALAYRDLDRTVDGLGRDGAAYRRLMEPLVKRSEAVTELLMGSLLSIPRDPVALASFGLAALDQGTPLWNRRFVEDAAPALLSGVAAHPVGRMPSLPSAGGGLMLGTLAHSVGWPIPVGGSQAIAEALADDLREHGGEISTGHRITSLDEVADSRAVILDVSPSVLLELGGDRLPPRYAKALQRFRYGNAACKVDFILSGPVPWTNPEMARTGTAHLGGTRAELAAAEDDVASGRHPRRPYVLLSQPSAFDASRAPAGRHVLWSYCHVPAGSTVDMTEAVTAQIERFAPGFRDVIVDSRVTTAADLAQYNANYVGGDFGGGAVTLAQMLIRPVLSPKPWRTTVPGVYLSSASTPPGPGVHGMGGLHAAKLALKDVFGLPVPDLAPEPG
ncbi:MULTISPECIES: NAD(P)/FAD-dependent oxidoreductase [unclassified Arthrobacter]|uniref:phytoene desaturase family protein n=1 Tax=unclassified Arthrobacter TaxID=235627 RepID=UPI0024DF906C|nr:MULTISPECIES: NAD(P)/FAD-dependent oxidoreductase [unclassified Arthrobacter]MCC9144297.1 NAD(P)/FAD-dependent oxidoreductase [Arthrobacter sp. zg-Y919]MDK1275523.1 NAD(P)/FAD-dependent oxidoreductase [Arthrobacter sp. zg.Y919]WIB03102.1 NAD(P)/FAD-dependent oxidoreductase [Arthrobacter sp. zg-Y919]